MPPDPRLLSGARRGDQSDLGDNPTTVATIAAKAGVPGADRAIDARSLPQGEELADLMEETTVFGRVNPDQKSAMVEALQNRGHTVAMTGDGVNDVLALKKADMGIAMGTGTAAAQAVSHLVLLDSRVSTLPGVVAEGRRVTANIERVSKMFTTKSVWAAILAIAVAAATVSYPIMPRHLTVIDSLTIGIPGFFLALAPNPRRFIPGFVLRMARFVLPTGLLAGITILLSYLLLREMGAAISEAQTMETIIFCVIGWRVIKSIEHPLRGWRLGLVLAMTLLLAGVFAIPFTREFFASTCRAGRSSEPPQACACLPGSSWDWGGSSATACRSGAKQPSGLKLSHWSSPPGRPAQPCSSGLRSTPRLQLTSGARLLPPRSLAAGSRGRSPPAAPLSVYARFSGLSASSAGSTKRPSLRTSTPSK